ncbi:MAG: hypothetical protein AAFV85_08870 [Cyanobacteria bacterium J06634_6]
MTSTKKRFRQTSRLPKFLLTVVALGFITTGVSSAQKVANAESVQTGTQTGKQVGDSTVLRDGTYLFGQSPQPDEIGSTYVVFSVKNNQTIGAFYQPRSSFDCFSGQLQPDRLAVTIVDSYTQTTYPYNVAVTLDNSLVAGNSAGSYTLDGFYLLPSLSVQDADMLAVCTADLAQ